MNRLHKTTVAVTVVLLAAALSGLAGCGSKDWKPSKMFSLDNTWPWRDDDEPSEGTPVRMVGAWTDTVLTRPGKNPERGFGGRVMFYGAEDEKPILVDGQLVVYAFDETGRDPTNNKPTRRYVFPSDQMPLHMSKSDMGASYSFWLPWDECDGPKTEVSLVCRFEPKGGAVVTGEQTRHLLPGAIALDAKLNPTQPPPLPEGVPSRPAQTTLESLRASQQIDSGAQLASFNSPAVPQPALPLSPPEAASIAPPRQMSVTSITLPDSFKTRQAAISTGAGAAAHAATPLPSQMQSPPTVQPQVQPANAGNGTMQTRPASVTPQTQTTNAFGSWPMIRPQMVTPQLATSGVGQTSSVPTSTWNTAAAGQAAFPQQQVAQQPVYQQPALLQIPASQPMPAPTGVTTTVSYPSQPAPAVPPIEMGQAQSFHSAPVSPPAPAR